MNCGSFNTFNVYPSLEEKIRAEAFASDYRITVTLDTKLTQPEDERLHQLKRTLTAERTEGLDRKTKDFWSRSSDAKGIVRLPSYQSERFSVYVYISDDSFFRIRPDSVRIDRENPRDFGEVLYEICCHNSRTRRCIRREPADSPRDQSNVIGG